MKREMYINQKYLLVPVNIKGETTVVSFYADGRKIYEFMIPIMDSSSADYYASLPVYNWNTQTITIEGDVPSNFLDAIEQSNELPVKPVNRPKYHFTPISGWINDPNGLVYKDGIYHLFFQHNPFHVEWGNMSWGHAISKDLLHWEQLEDVMFPDEDGTIFSGCAITNERGLLGLPKDALIFFYTSAGGTSNWSKEKKFVQKIAYSLDNGRTLIKRKTPILEHIAGENRDPKVYWHEESSVYYMILYLEENDFAIFNSQDLEHWETTQRLTLPGAWECPDLREIPIEGGGSKWMILTADGYYYLGDFDGHYFATDYVRHEAFSTKLPYAAQTFYGTDRVIMIPWLRTQNPNQVYRGMMGIPRKLSLVEKNGEYLLQQKFVNELNQELGHFTHEN